jgi:hypothetical protein
MKSEALVWAESIMVVRVLAVGTVVGAAAQQPLTTPDPNAVMGFESLGTWNVSGNGSSPGFMAASTTTRTQGSAALSVSNPPNLMKLTSQPIASTATALEGVGDPGALLQISSGLRHLPMIRPSIQEAT